MSVHFEDWYRAALDAELERVIARVDESPPEGPTLSLWSRPRREELLVRMHRAPARALEVARSVVVADDGAELWRVALSETRGGAIVARVEISRRELSRLAALLAELASSYHADARARALLASEAAE